MAIVSLTTDFGVKDGYVGTMKGVMVGIEPGLTMVDITHDVPPQGVREAAYVLWTSLPYFPEDAIHLVVVDPGVGTTRRAIASRTAWGTLVGPDNGVFSYVWEQAPAQITVALSNKAYQRPAISGTFHGRDVFSPAAAHIAAGVQLQELGERVSDPVRLPPPQMVSEETMIRGEVLYVDHFGNVITSIGRLVWEGTSLLHLDPVFVEGRPSTLNPRRARVSAGDRDLGPILTTYGQVAPGQALALVGSEGMLEIAVNQGSAGRTLSLVTGDPVAIVFR